MKTGKINMEISRLYDKLIRITKMHGQYENSTIQNAYDILRILEKKDHELKIDHSLRVAITIAQMGFSSDVITAALLHGLYNLSSENLNNIKHTISDTNVFEILDYYNYLNKTLETYASSMDTLEIQVKNDFFTKALYIKLADRIDILKHTQIDSSLYTNNSQAINRVLLKLARDEDAWYLIDELEDECFRLSKPSLYKIISDQYQKMIQDNSKITQQTRTIFNTYFDNVNSFSHNSTFPLKNNTISYSFKSRKPISIYRQLTKKYAEKDNLVENHITKYQIPLYNITLVFNDNSTAFAIDSFFEFYKKELLPKKTRIIGCNYTSDQSDFYFLLEDYSCCKYRLFLKDKSTYLKRHYGFGASINIRFRQEQQLSISDSQIFVYDQSKKIHYLEKGSTVLDFAFLLHPNIGYCAKSAYINDIKTPFPLSTKLKSGDHVVILSDSKSNQYHAKIEWFEYVNTKRSTKYLIQFFTEISHYPEKSI